MVSKPSKVIDCRECKKDIYCRCSIISFCKHSVGSHTWNICRPYKAEEFSGPGLVNGMAKCSHLASGDLPQSLFRSRDTVFGKQGIRLRGEEEEEKDEKRQCEVNSPLMKSSEIYCLKNGTLTSYSILKRNKRTIKMQMSLEHSQSAICVYSNKVYFIGGGKLNTPFLSILVLNTKNNKIKTLASLTTPRFMPCCVVYKGNLYVIGGCDNKHQVCKSIEIVNILNKRSQTIPFDINRKRTSATVLKDNIYICAEDQLITVLDPINLNVVKKFVVDIKNLEILAITSCSCTLYVLIKNWVYIIQDSTKDYDLLIPVKASFEWTQQEIRVVDYGLHFIDYFSSKVIEILVEKKSGSLEFLAETEENLYPIHPKVEVSMLIPPPKNPFDSSDADILELLGDSSSQSFII